MSKTQVQSRLLGLSGTSPVIVSSQTVTSVSTVTFSGLSSSARYQLFVILGQVGSAGGSFIRFNSDSGSNYAWYNLGGSGQSAGSTRNMSTTGINFVDPVGSGSVQVGDAVIGQMIIASNPVSTNQVYVNGTCQIPARGDGFPMMLVIGGRYSGSAPMTSMTYNAIAGTFTGTLTLTQLP